MQENPLLELAIVVMVVKVFTQQCSTIYSNGLETETSAFQTDAELARRSLTIYSNCQVDSLNSTKPRG